MNKFLNRGVKPLKTKEKQAVPRERGEAHEFLEECAACWASLETARKKMRRSLMYAYEDQWGDYIRDPETDAIITEGELIKKNGKIPLKNNMISPIIKNIDGQFRNNVTQTICSVRDQKETKLGEMVSLALEYVHDLNELNELDADSLRLLLLGGFIGQRIEYGFNPSKRTNDAWVFGVNPARMFFNTNIEDVRGWDLNVIGEVYDMHIDNIVSLFAKSPEDKAWIEEIYGNERYTSLYASYDGLQGEENKNMTFYSPSRPDLRRVIFGWKQETREAYYCHDLLNGKWFFEDLKNKRALDLENDRRLAEAQANGVLPEDVLLIEYKYSNELYWYYRYMTPWGDVLQEGRSPYWHEEHNYVFHAYPMVQGRVFNFVEDFIDQQRAINRTMTLIDFIRGASSKGVIIVDESAFESMNREEIVDEYVRYNGVIFVKPKDGKRVQDVVQQCNSSANTAGDYELLNLQLKLINDIAGVNGAMQGKQAPSGTAASLYAQQVQNSSLNLKGLLDSFRAFRRRRDYKLVQTIQQYYKSARYLDIAGRDYSNESKYYDPDKVQNAIIDLQIIDGPNTPSFQMLENEFLMKLFESNAIGVKTLLENSSYAFSGKILESIKRDEQAAQEAQAQQQQLAFQGIDPALMQQVEQQSGNQHLSQLMNDDSMAGKNDGVVKKAA